MNSSQEFAVNVTSVIDELKLEIVFMPDGVFEIKSADLNTPGMQIAGFFDHFDNKRIQVFGEVESAYLAAMTPAVRRESLHTLFGRGLPAVVVTRGGEIFQEMLEAAAEFCVPVLRTQESTSRLMSMLAAYLNLELADRITRHGALVEVYGIGILILGESGVGKSETVIELIKRGHRLVADDAVEIKKVSTRSLVGSCPQIIRHFIELRGIGIVDVKEIFGIGAVKDTERIELVVNLEAWKDKKQYDRLGADSEYTDILGLKIPSLTIPVKPGRNLAVIIEVAAMNNRQKQMGRSAAELLNKRLEASMADKNQESIHDK